MSNIEDATTKTIDTTETAGSEDVSTDAETPTGIVLIVQHVTKKYGEPDEGNAAFNPDELIGQIEDWVAREHPVKVIVTYQDSRKELYERLIKLVGDPKNDIVPWKWDVEWNDTKYDFAEKNNVPVDEVYVVNYDGDNWYCLIYPWIQALEGSKVTIIGGYRGECVEALYQSLIAIGIEAEVEEEIGY